MYTREMNMREPVVWNDDDLLNLRQIAVLLRRRLEAVRESVDHDQTIAGVFIPAPVGDHLWNPAQVHDIFWTVPQGIATRTYSWDDTEMLRPKQIAALHRDPVAV